MALILIIDDDSAVRLSISAYLDDLGHEVLEANGGVQGLTLFEQKKPDLLLVDIRMPDLDGLSVLEFFTAMEFT